jgi:hypothetical protein
LTSRDVFFVAAAAISAVVLFYIVVRPAVERGGYGELAGIALLFVAILLGERWLRSR